MTRWSPFASGPRSGQRWTRPAWLRSCRFVSWAVVAMFALLALVALAEPASAHASLESTSPSDRSEVDEAPDRMEFSFNEEVSAAPGALRVHDRDGARVDDALQVQVSADTVAVGLQDLPDGGYLATYLVTSADGHVVRGAVTFQVGGGQALDDATVAALFAGGDGVAVAWAQRVTTAVQYAAALVALGALVPLLRTRRSSSATQGAGLVGPADPAERADLDDAAVDATAAAVASLERGVAAETVRTAALAGIAAALVAIPLQAMAVSGQGLAALGSTAALEAVLTSSVGLANLTLVAGLLGVFASARGRLRPGQLGGSALLVVGSFLLAGHTLTVAPTWLIMGADVVHVLAAGIWAGGLVVVVRTWRRADGAGPAGLAAMVARFSGVALWAMLALATAGGAMTWALARQPRAIVSTDWGWTLVVKVGLVGLVAAMAAYNRWRLLPAIAGSEPDGAVARGQLATTMRIEAGLLAAILLTTAILTGLRPAAAEAGITGAFDTVVAVDDALSVNLVVDPNRAGANQVHVYLLDATGRPTDAVDELTLELLQVDEDVGPIVRTPAPAGPGHWILSGNDLAIPGRWRVTVVVGVDRFTEQRADVEVVVNPA